MECGILQTSPEELSLYGMENSHLASMRIRRYALRTDGFVSVNGGFASGEFTTPPFKFSREPSKSQPSHLAINFSTSAVGSIQVEMQDADGNPVPGRSISDCPQIYGDSIERVVVWNDGPVVREFAGKPIRLRFVIKDADLYAFNFR